MKKVFILVEGQTEELFVKNVLSPHLADRDIYCTPILAATRRIKSGPDFKGGITSYNKVKQELQRLLRDTSVSLVTTMIDYYGFISLVPFKSDVAGSSSLEKVRALESLFTEDLGDPRFFPYVQLHEFEAMMYVSPTVTAEALMSPRNAVKLERIKKEFISPEEIDDHPQTAPSKRLLKLFPGYRKTVDGPIIVKRTGLDEIRQQCGHLNEWITRLEHL